MTIVYICLFIMIAAVIVQFVGRIVTENAYWGEPWVWIVFGAGVFVMCVDMIVSVL